MKKYDLEGLFCFRRVLPGGSFNRTGTCTWKKIESVHTKKLQYIDNVTVKDTNIERIEKQYYSELLRQSYDMTSTFGTNVAPSLTKWHPPLGQ